MKRIFAGAIGLLLGLVVARATDLAGLPQVVLERDGITLQNWLLIGSFKAASDEEALDVDFLNRFGSTESACRSEDLIKLASQLTAVASHAPLSANCATGVTKVNFKTAFRKFAGSNEASGKRNAASSISTAFMLPPLLQEYVQPPQECTL